MRLDLIDFAPYVDCIFRQEKNGMEVEEGVMSEPLYALIGNPLLSPGEGCLRLKSSLISFIVTH